MKIDVDHAYRAPGIGHLKTLSGADGVPTVAPTTPMALTPLDPGVQSAVIVAGLAWLGSLGDVKVAAAAGGAYYVARQLGLLK